MSAAAGKGPVCGLVTVVTAGGRAFVLSVSGSLRGEAPTAHYTCAGWAGGSLVVAATDGTLTAYDRTFSEQASAQLPEDTHPVSLHSVGDARLLLFATDPSSRAASAQYLRASARAHREKAEELVASPDDPLATVTSGAEEAELETDAVAPMLGQEADDYEEDTATVTVRGRGERGKPALFPDATSLSLSRARRRWSTSRPAAASLWETSMTPQRRQGA